ncbi:uncharacterized protein LOC124823578 [Vigna umbellata]|uniref:uncharacterized protein LOC124823578 n=1 Tax=Vigna umbellata TaxID=87088 RepID=UPI001F5F87A5|nr:uncharacterized protein LOC124823578 [Vigna umbellata]
MKGVDIREKVQRKWNIGISRSMTYRAKGIASEHIDGSFKEQYKRVYDYAHELLGRNHDSTVKMHVENNEDEGLLLAIQDLFPGVDHRFCVRHLYSNFRKKFPGKNLKRLMWRAATATHPQNWGREMINIKDVNEDAFKHLIAISPRYWSRSRFSPTPKCDTLVNNMSEAFNSVLVHTRTEPIITMLEEIRVYIMQRWAKNRSKIQSLTRSICPKIQTRFTKESQSTKKWIPSWSGKKLFEVRHVSHSGDKFVFTYEETYASIIYHINGNNMWDLTPYSDVMHPTKKVMPGRPKKKRRLEQWEIKKDDSRLSKAGLRKRCGLCREVGHNKSRFPKVTQQPTHEACHDEEAQP